MTAAPAAHLVPILALLKQRDLAGALTAAEGLLPSHPGDAALLGIAALAALQLGDAPRAVPLLRRQLDLAPHDAAVRFNLASALAGLGEIEQALGVVGDWAGRPRLARLAGYLHQQSEDNPAAIEAYRAALAAFPEDWESWNNLGNCLAALGDSDGAVAAFERAINHAPGLGQPELFLNLGRAMSKAEDREPRLRAAIEARRRFPDNHQLHVELGLAQAAAWRVEEAEQTLLAAAANETTFSEARIELGLLYENNNRLDALDALIAESEQLPPSAELAFLQAWSLRRKDRFEEAAALAARIPGTINPLRTAQLRAELADRLGDPGEAFRQWTIMNEAARAAHPRRVGPSFRAKVEAQTAAMSPPRPGTSRSPVGQVPRDPIFVVGSPRSGTTLLDTLLGNLPELQVFEEIPVLATVETEFPDLIDADEVTVEVARRRYFVLAEQFEGPAQGRWIVDKMPLHIAHMPTIHRLFPQASIVLAERHPCDAVLSCYMANFGPNFAMLSYTDLEEAARTYDAIFANWRRATALLPLKIHRVRYERMISDLEGEMRPLLTFLGIEWRDAVLDNQSSAVRRGAVKTASYAQIGQPLYKRAVGRWERYREQLEPVMPILAPWVAAFEAGDL